MEKYELACPSIKYVMTTRSSGLSPKNVVSFSARIKNPMANKYLCLEYQRKKAPKKILTCKSQILTSPSRQPEAIRPEMVG